MVHVNAETTPAWTREELARIGGATELQIASRRNDGSLRPFVTIWIVRVEDELYIRSAYGTDNPWFRRARTNGSGRIRAGGVERDVAFSGLPIDSDMHAGIDAAYHAKYDRYGPQIVGTVTGAHAAPGTLRLVPQR
jgi:hypothetical protein